MKVWTPLKTHSFQLLQLIEFNSERKRMSCIVWDEEKNIFLLVKGADNVILDRSEMELMDGSTKNDLKVHLKVTSSQGLWLLVLAYKKLNAETFELWNQKYQRALENQSLHGA